MQKKLFFILIFIFSILTGEAAYFQQDVDYEIHVRLNDRKHELSCFEKIIYKNNSPDSLTELYFHLWPAAYKDKNTLLAKEIFRSGEDRMISSADKDFGTIDSIDLRVNDVKVKWELLKDTIDVCRIILNKSLLPGQSITISTPFRVKIPSAKISRLGHNGEAYFITQWYPKPAVYDENGWNYFPYLDQGEYYSEFASYNVFITLPENYIVAGTGVMVDAQKEYAWLNQKDSITRTIKKFPEADPKIETSRNIKTLHFHQDNIHDFAWIADKRWNVLKETIVLKSNRRITSWSFFNNAEAEYWKNVPSYMRESILKFSEWIGEYPYQEITSVDVGNAYGGGMEYPMLALIGNYGDLFETELTVVHEMAHQWFYGILGSNERRHAWMDEGITNFYETRFTYTKYNPDSAGPVNYNQTSYFNLYNLDWPLNHRKKQLLEYLYMARMNRDQSPSTSPDSLSNQNYGANAYYKASISFDYLNSYLGDSLFDACMKDYYEKWKFRHPQPDDLMNAFEKTSGKKLDWFKDLITTTKKLDYKITRVFELQPGQVELYIKNTGEIRGPVPISGMKNGKPLYTLWREGFRGDTMFNLPCYDCDGLRIDAEEKMPELYYGNNSIRLTENFKTGKLQLKFGAGYEDSNNTTIWYSPVPGWNYYNKLMAGFVVHNVSFLEKKFEYRLMPLFAIGTTNIAGGGDIRYHIYPDNRIYRITLRAGISRYAFGNDIYNFPLNDNVYENTLHYTKFDSRITFDISEKYRQNNFENEIELRYVFLNRDVPYGLYYKEKNVNIRYYIAEYRRSNRNPLDHSLQKINFTFNKDFIHATAETNHFLTYGRKNKGFGIRMFVGISENAVTNDAGIDYSMNLSGKTGLEDYLFDEVFLGRSEEKGILSRQFKNDYAGFKTPTTFYRLSEEWMTGINVSTTLPGLIPFRLFMNAGMFDGSDRDGEFGKISWEAGVDLPVIKDIFVIYLPFAYSNDIKYVVEERGLTPFELARFELRLNMLNPLDHIKSAYEN